jgi:hypothetical protein
MAQIKQAQSRRPEKSLLSNLRLFPALIRQQKRGACGFPESRPAIIKPDAALRIFEPSLKITLTTPKPGLETLVAMLFK